MVYSSEFNINSALRSTIAFVLAGGRGSRLYDLTADRAKPAVYFAGKFRIIDFPLSNCINSGIRKVVVPTQYKAHDLIQHVYRTWGFLRYELGEYVSALPAQQQVDESTWYRGTSDAVWQNKDIIKNSNAEYILILAGDHIYKQDYSKMLYQHIQRGADVSVSCIEVAQNEADRFGVIEIDKESRIIGFEEKPSSPKSMPDKKGTSLISMGIYIFNKQFLIDILDRDTLSDDKTDYDFGKNIIPSCIDKSNIYAHKFIDSCVGSVINDTPYWRDVGTVDSYWETNMDLTNVTPELNIYDDSWPIWTHQAQRPSAKFIFNDDDRRGYAVDSLVSGGVIVSGSKISRSLLSTDVRVHSYCEVTDSILLPAAQISRSVKLNKCIIDANVIVPEGSIIGFDKVNDAQNFYVTEKGVTVVTQSMIDKLVAKSAT